MDLPRANSLQRTLRACSCLLLLFSMSGISADAADQQAIAGLISQAEAQQEQARLRQHAWSATSDYIADARALMAAGELDKAQAMAQRALKAAEASLKQADDEATAWQARVPTL